MKKLLSLLSILTISGTAVPTTIAASPYQKEEKLNRNKREEKNKYNTILECNNNYENHDYWKNTTSEVKIIISESEFNELMQFLTNNNQEKIKVAIEEWKRLLELDKNKRNIFWGDGQQKAINALIYYFNYWLENDPTNSKEWLQKEIEYKLLYNRYAEWKAFGSNYKESETNYVVIHNKNEKVDNWSPQNILNVLINKDIHNWIFSERVNLINFYGLYDKLKGILWLDLINKKIKFFGNKEKIHLSFDGEIYIKIIIRNANKIKKEIFIHGSDNFNDIINYNDLQHGIDYENNDSIEVYTKEPSRTKIYDSDSDLLWNLFDRGNNKIENNKFIIIVNNNKFVLNALDFIITKIDGIDDKNIIKVISNKNCKFFITSDNMLFYKKKQFGYYSSP